MYPKLYMLHGSSPSRTVLITARALDVTLDLCELNYHAGDFFTPEYLKLNPLHTVPTLNDNGNVICDSHAISAYLVDKYGKDDSFYPKGLYKRALVDQRLHFDTGVLHYNLKYIAVMKLNCFNSYLLQMGFTKGEIKEIPTETIEDILEAYNILETFLENHNWVAGDAVTIADFSLVATASSLNVVVPIDSNQHPNIINWFKRAQCLSYFKLDEEELKIWKEMYLSILPK